MRSVPVVAAVLLPLFASSAPAQVAREIDPEQIRRQLDELIQEGEQVKDRRREELIREIEKAASSPVSAERFYEDAVRDTEFRGRTAQLQNFVEWRRENEWLNSAEFRAAVQLHLRYLALTLRRGAADEPADFIRPSREYLDAYAEAEKRYFAEQGKPPDAQKELLNSELGTSVFAKALRLESYLGKIPDWEMTPGNAQGILEKNVRAAMRKTKDEALITTWDYQIKWEQEQVANEKLEHAADEFAAIRLPTLRFERARDMLLLGQTSPAVREIMTLIENHPDHPEFETWVAVVEEVLSAPEAAAEGSGTTE